MAQFSTASEQDKYILSISVILGLLGLYKLGRIFLWNPTNANLIFDYSNITQLLDILFYSACIIIPFVILGAIFLRPEGKASNPTIDEMSEKSMQNSKGTTAAALGRSILPPTPNGRTNSAAAPQAEKTTESNCASENEKEAAKKIAIKLGISDLEATQLIDQNASHLPRLNLIRFWLVNRDLITAQEIYAAKLPQEITTPQLRAFMNSDRTLINPKKALAELQGLTNSECQLILSTYHHGVRGTQLRDQNLLQNDIDTDMLANLKESISAPGKDNWTTLLAELVKCKAEQPTPPPSP